MTPAACTGYCRIDWGAAYSSRNCSDGKAGIAIVMSVLAGCSFLEV